MKKLSIFFLGMMILAGVSRIAYAENRWTGFYGGINGGLGFNDVHIKSQQLGFTDPNDTCNVHSNFTTFFPGMQLGYAYQFPYSFVLGVDANVTFNVNPKKIMGCKSDFNSGVYDRLTFRDRLQTSVRGRIGYGLILDNNHLLPYFIAGASFINVKLTYQNEGGDYYSNSTTRAGWLVGAGLEWGFLQDWSLRAEYYYADYGNAINLKIPSIYGLLDSNGNARVDFSSNNVVLSINYWISI